MTTKRIIWLSDKESYDFDVPYIMLHAISKETSTYPKPCIYCQLDADCDENEDEYEEDDETEPSECFFAPEDQDILMTLFDMFSQTAQLNPDPEEEEAEGEGFVQYATDDFIYNEDEVMNGVQQVRE